MQIKKKFLGGIFCSLSALLMAVEPQAAGDGQPAPQLRIVTSFYPVYIATLNVAKDIPGVQVVNLTKPFTGCLHDYQLVPDDLKTLANADVFIINGAGMESFLEKAVREIPQLKTIDAGKNIALIKDKNGANPHVWLSVTLAMKQVQNITAGLIERDPAHASLYQHNCDDYVHKLEVLRSRMKAELKQLKSREIVTFHEAFPYFAQEFDFKIVAVVERDPGSEPSAREMVETVQLIKKHKARAIFIEPQYPDKSAHAIAHETGASVCLLDPAVTGPMTENAYLQIMEKNLAALVKTLKD
ncbi:MAG: zinc ABC transporter substrate-binding protein [Gallionella sp.]|nr:MAG: zinc ABC transporter substrate-binding protein [Gallionella sp.]